MNQRRPGGIPSAEMSELAGTTPGMHAKLSPELPARPQRSPIRLLQIPDPAPPYDDAFGAPGQIQPVATAAPTQAQPVAAAAPRQTQPVTGARACWPDGWPRQFAQVLAETLAGSRSADQLRPWTTEQTRRRIRQLGPMLATGQRPRVVRIMTSAPSPDVVEMTAVVCFGPRTRVLALRLERSEPQRPGPGRAGSGPPGARRWLCTAIESA